MTAGLLTCHHCSGGWSTKNEWRLESVGRSLTCRRRHYVGCRRSKTHLSVKSVLLDLVNQCPRDSIRSQVNDRQYYTNSAYTFGSINSLTSQRVLWLQVQVLKLQITLQILVGPYPKFKCKYQFSRFNYKYRTSTQSLSTSTNTSMKGWSIKLCAQGSSTNTIEPKIQVEALVGLLYQ